VRCGCSAVSRRHQVPPRKKLSRQRGGGGFTKAAGRLPSVQVSAIAGRPGRPAWDHRKREGGGQLGSPPWSRLHYTVDRRAPGRGGAGVLEHRSGKSRGRDSRSDQGSTNMHKFVMRSLQDVLCHDMLCCAVSCCAAPNC
jgi:hypothetical protein